MTNRRLIAAISTLVLALAACGGADDGGSAADDGGTGEGDVEDFADAVNEAMGAGGGGTLVFDGQEIVITSATCLLGDDLEVGSISDEGYRVQISQGSNDISVQILDESFMQWFPQDVTGDEADYDGDKTFMSDPTPYFNNQDDRVIEASFTLTCP